VGQRLGNTRVCAPVRFAAIYARTVLVYRVHDTTGDDLGTILHAAMNVEPGDIVFLSDRREALVTAGSRRPQALHSRWGRGHHTRAPYSLGVRCLR